MDDGPSFRDVRTVACPSDFQDRIFVWPADGESPARIYWGIVASNPRVLCGRYELAGEKFNCLTPRTHTSIGQPESVAEDEA
jgi:hypothetical protein